MHEYCRYPDGTEAVFSDIYIGENGEECIDIHFERPTEDGFDSVRIKLPSYEIVIWEGNYSEKEIEMFKTIVERGASHFYQWAREGGIHLS